MGIAMAVVVACGIGLGVWLPPGLWIPCMLAAGAACWSAAIVWRGAPVEPAPGGGPMILLMAGWLAVGAVCGGLARAEAARDPLRPWIGRAVTLTGVLEGSVGHRAGERVTWLMAADQGAGPVLVACEGGRGAVGQRVQIRGLLSPLRGPRNPLEPDRRARWAWQEVHEILRADPRGFMVLDGGTRHGILGWAGALRDRMEAVIQRLVPGPDGRLLSGIVLGDAQALDPDQGAAFRVTGTYHILAASGMNVGIVALAVLAVMGWCGLPKSWAAGGAILAIALYTLVCGAQASLVRAAIMGAIMLLAPIVGRGYSPDHGLGIAVTGMLLVHPVWLMDPSFQLSVAAVAGILALASYLERALRHWPAWLRTNLAVTLGAQIAVGPLMAMYFQQWSLIAPLANLVIVPLAEILLPLGLIAALLGMCWAPLALPAAGWLKIGLWALIHAAAWLADIPGASLTLPAYPQWLWWGVCALTAGGIWALHRLGARRLLRQGVPWAAILAAVVLVTAGLWWHPPAALRMTVFDVGEGDSILLRLPGGEAVLVDGGPGPDPGGRWAGAGATVIVPALRRLGVTRLSAIILTHPHQDHFGGLSAVLAALPVMEVLDGEQSCDHPLYRRFVEETAALRIPYIRVAPGQCFSFSHGVTITVLAPVRPLLSNTNDDYNNNSVVLRVVTGRVRFLLAGDLQVEGEARLLEGGVDCRAQVLKVGHHGSRDATSAAFVTAVHPQVAVASAGGRRRHPDRAVLARLAAAGAACWHTDQDGAVTVSTDGERIWTESVVPRFTPSMPIGNTGR